MHPNALPRIEVLQPYSITSFDIYADRIPHPATAQKPGTPPARPRAPKAAPRSRLTSCESWVPREQEGNCKTPAGRESQRSRECRQHWILLDHRFAHRCIRDLVTL